jgi:hypothetical protein
MHALLTISVLCHHLCVLQCTVFGTEKWSSTSETNSYNNVVYSFKHAILCLLHLGIPMCNVNFVNYTFH